MAEVPAGAPARVHWPLIGLLVTLSLTAGSALVRAGSVEQRVTNLERATEGLPKMADTLARVDERTAQIQGDVHDLKQRSDKERSW